MLIDKVIAFINQSVNCNLCIEYRILAIARHSRIASPIDSIVISKNTVLHAAYRTHYIVHTCVQQFMCTPNTFAYEHRTSDIKTNAHVIILFESTTPASANHHHHHHKWGCSRTRLAYAKLVHSRAHPPGCWWSHEPHVFVFVRCKCPPHGWSFNVNHTSVSL